MAQAILYDATKCTACRACQVACKQWNELPAETTTNWGTYENPRDLSSHTWVKIKFKELPKDTGIDWLFTRQACMHCTDASCEQVCPTGAISHQDGFVIIDQEWCIGCGYCTQACPFHIPHKDEVLGIVRKCTSCISRRSNGLEPTCVKTCPTGALIIGDRDALVAEGRKRVEALKAEGYSDAYLYGDEELGGLHVLYVLDDSPVVYGLPESPQVAISTSVGQWMSGILTAGVLAALPFWLLFRRRKQIEAEQKSKVEGGVR